MIQAHKCYKILFLFFVLLFLFSCPAEPLVVDSKIFTNFSPFTLEEDDIVLVQNPSPLTIEIWNGETNKLKNRYVFKKEVDTSISKTGYAYLSAIDYDMIGDDIWLIAEYAQCNLIKFNITTGELNFVARNVNDYDTLKIISKDEDNLGTVWISQFMQPLSGGFVRCYDLSGKLLHKFEIKAEDLDFSVNNLRYENTKYCALCTHNVNEFGSFDSKLDEQEGFRIIEFNLKEKKYNFKDIPYSTFFSSRFLSQFDYIPDRFECAVGMQDENYCNLLLCMDKPDGSYIIVSFLYYYKCNEGNYEFVNAFSDEQDINRTVYYAKGDVDDYTIIGKDKTSVGSYFIDTYKDDILITRYKVDNLRGEQLPRNNHPLQWFGCGNDTTFSSVYIYDWQNNKVYLLQDGGERQDISSECIATMAC